MRALIGTKSGKRVYASYTHKTGSLPELRIAGSVWRGSSLGPANPMAKPSSDDRHYWANIAKGKGLIDEEA